jgi:hypothetical protein
MSDRNPASTWTAAATVTAARPGEATVQLALTGHGPNVRRLDTSDVQTVAGWAQEHLKDSEPWTRYVRLAGRLAEALDAVRQREELTRAVPAGVASAATADAPIAAQLSEWRAEAEAAARELELARQLVGSLRRELDAARGAAEHALDSALAGFRPRLAPAWRPRADIEADIARAVGPLAEELVRSTVTAAAFQPDRLLAAARDDLLSRAAPPSAGAPRPTAPPPNTDIRPAPGGSRWQAVPTVGAEKFYGPAFATKAQARYAAALLRKLLGRERAAVDSRLSPEERGPVEKAVAAFIDARRLQPIAPGG